MYVIVEINGQQFKAEQGKKLFVHHIQNAESGAVVEFDKVLLVDNNGEVTVGGLRLRLHLFTLCGKSSAKIEFFI